MRSEIVRLLLLAGGALTATSGCDTGFGQPCTLPKTDEFRRACNPAPEDPNAEPAGENDIVRDSKASCAVKNFAGCETRVCLVYRGSDSYCSEPCRKDNDCEGSSVCRPLLGDTDLEGNVCEGTDAGVLPECYCVKKGDL